MSNASGGEKLSWGIIGTGAIAHTFAQGVIGSRSGRLAAVGSRGIDTAKKFADEFQIPHRHGSYDDLLADADVQAVYIATPHPQHAEWAIKAARAKKHVLCEKPIGLNFSEARRIIDAAIEHDVFLMEAFMYRCHPQTHKLVELIRDKAIGDVRVIQATFSYHWPKPYDPASSAVRHLSAGGGVLDVGCYPVSMSRLIAGAAAGKPFADPIDVKGAGHLGPQRTDDYAAAILKFPGGILAQVSTGVQVDQENVVRIFGSDGSIFISDPWVPNREPGVSKLVLKRSDEKHARDIEVRVDRGLYSIEADTVAEHLAHRQAPPPAMTWDDTLGNMKTLDRWREQIGLRYDMELAQ